VSVPGQFTADAAPAERAYAVLMATFVVLLVLTNIIGVKLFQVFPGDPAKGWMYATLTSGLTTYPLTFLVTDTVSEIYGKKRADRMVYVGFFLSLIMLAVVQVVVALPGSPHWVNDSLGFGTPAAMQTAFESVFTLPGTLVLGSMSAYLVAQLLDNKLFHFWRRVTGGRHLWLRNNASTIVSQAADTIIVNTIFLGWGLGMPADVVIEIIIANYIFKVCIALVDTPLVYLLVGGLRRHLELESK
jgi:uncharacterized integral membrane protein (TIGR00697 family)